ncbi:hypothetical protein BDV32DRAFT_143169 [Aspergillus pseudonomiae]|nr:hypothetical protein BDV32DRAFT_143169 [Aspergillus pseudonomiae]
MGKSAKRKREREKALLEQGQLSQRNVDNDGDELMDRDNAVGHADSTESKTLKNGHYTLEQRQVTTRIMLLHEKDYYNILGLQRDCTMQDIRKAYLKLGRRTHPDQNRYKDAPIAFKSLPEHEGSIKMNLLQGFAESYRTAAQGNNLEDLTRIRKQFDYTKKNHYYPMTLQKLRSGTWRIRRPPNKSLAIYRAADFADPRLSNMATPIATWLKHTSLCQRRRKKMCVAHRSGIARMTAPSTIGF